MPSALLIHISSGLISSVISLHRLRNRLAWEGRVESTNTPKVIVLKTAQRAVFRDRGEHHAPTYIGMHKTQQVTDFVQGDGLDVESARCSINPSVFRVIEVTW